MHFRHPQEFLFSVDEAARRAHVAGDLVKVGPPGAAASAPDVDVRVPPRESAHELTEIRRVTDFEMTECARPDRSAAGQPTGVTTARPAAAA